MKKTLPKLPKRVLKILKKHPEPRECNGPGCSHETDPNSGWCKTCKHLGVNYCNYCCACEHYDSYGKDKHEKYRSEEHQKWVDEMLDDDRSEAIGIYW